MQAGTLIKVGDAVSLRLLPGDDPEEPRVARLQALWSQVPKDGRERMFAQCCLFYRPSVRLLLLPSLFLGEVSGNGLPLMKTNPFICQRMDMDAHNIKERIAASPFLRQYS